MSRRYRKKRSAGRAKPSLISLAPVAVLGAMAIKDYQDGGIEGAISRVVIATTGYSTGSNTWKPEQMLPFYGTIAGAYIGKKLIAMSGVNRAMKGLPFRL